MIARQRLVLLTITAVRAPRRRLGMIASVVRPMLTRQMTRVLTGVSIPMTRVLHRMMAGVSHRRVLLHRKLVHARTRRLSAAKRHGGEKGYE